MSGKSAARNGPSFAVVLTSMLFTPFRRAAVSRGFFLLGAGAMLFPARAAELSAPSSLVVPLPVAPVLESDESNVEAPLPTFSRQIRASKPNFAPRAVPATRSTNYLAPPPDGFYQTPFELQNWLLDLSQIRPSQVKTRVLGRTPGGRALIALEITPPGVPTAKLRRLVVLCRQHGNEPEASASGARFIREFLTSKDPKKQRIARRTALLIVPIANPDGAAVYRRRTDAKIDMNRDWGRQKSPEVRLLARWIVASKPHLVVDVHQWLPGEHQHQPMAEASGGIVARQTAQRMARNSARRGYVLAARSRWGLDTLCHRYWGQRFKIPAILLESRHRPTVPGAREVAIGTSLTALWSAAETIAK
jgi:hypothetical protein